MSATLLDGLRQVALIFCVEEGNLADFIQIEADGVRHVSCFLFRGRNGGSVTKDTDAKVTAGVWGMSGGLAGGITSGLPTVVHRHEKWKSPALFSSFFETLVSLGFAGTFRSLS